MQDTDDDKDLVDTPGSSDDSDLVGWVMSRVERWRKHRDQNYKSDWDTYWSLWTGKWDPSLVVKKAERSRIIAPASQNAVDQTVSEMVEATFGRGKWFDLSNDENSQMEAADVMLRDRLIDDFHRDRVISAVIDTYYNGAIFGTGIAKRVIERGTTNRVYWAAIKPSNFVIDTAATCIDDALGCAHETIRPRHEIEQKQESGEYMDGGLGEGVMPASYHGSSSSQFDLLSGFSGDSAVDSDDGVVITEYHGLVPARFLAGDSKPSAPSPDSDILAEIQEDNDGDELVEAIVVIGNGAALLKKAENTIKDPNGVADRGFVAYQHHKCPNSFWGIGQMQKALNAQIGLDSELRARADTLALTTYPMVGADATRLPKNLRLEVLPGKMLLTNGRPSEIIEGLKIGQLDPISFQQSSEYERMVQMATGAADPSKSVNPSVQYNTATGASMQATGFIKRAKLTMQNVDTDFLDPLVKKSLWAYMAVLPKRYPKGVEFQVNSTMSIMAREFEQGQMTNLLAIIPHDSPMFLPVLRSIVENYSGPAKDKILESLDKASQPNPQQQQMQQAQATLQIQHLQKQNQFLDAQIAELQSRIPVNQTKAHQNFVQAALAPRETAVQEKQADAGQAQAAVAVANAHISHQKVHGDLLKAHLAAKVKRQQQPSGG